MLGDISYFFSDPFEDFFSGSSSSIVEFFSLGEEVESGETLDVVFGL